MNKDNICDRECCGCAACSAICPVQAISMQENERGFKVPIIDNRKCIDCKACQKVCREKNKFYFPKEVLIAKHSDNDVYLASQSGGAFTAISNSILFQNGIVYGAALNEKLELFHVRATTIEERDKMRGSKYLQSNIEDVYQLLLQDLKAGFKVLFTGTPCQVAGIVKYVKTKKVDSSNLFTVDILCHGVPSVLIWRDLKKYYESKYQCQVNQMVLKETSKSKRLTHCYLIKDKLVSDELYRKLYYSNLALRKVCYHCEYTSPNRVGDFSIGDAWGVKEKEPAFFDEKGVSLIMFNTDKALQFKDTIMKNMNTGEVPLKDYMQQCMIKPAAPKRSPEGFWRDYKSRSFVYIIQKYAKHNVLLNISYIYSRLIKAITK